MDGSDSTQSEPGRAPAPRRDPSERRPLRARLAPGTPAARESLRRALLGTGVAVALVVALGAAMFPFRGHLNVATTALVLVIPVVVGVAVGGFAAGVAATACGFLLYDLVFIPPYYTLYVGAAQNWTALGVYAVVMVVASRVVAQMRVARADAQARAAEVRRLFDLSELLVRESSATDLLETIVRTVREAFSLDGAALLMPADGRLDLVASDGEPLSEEELANLSAGSGPVHMNMSVVRKGAIQAVALAASGQPIGLLALRGLSPGKRERELLGAFVNHLALALERSQLQEQALRAQLLEEVDRLRRSLVGAVSHDLRTPLATIKVSTSTLLDPDAAIDRGSIEELVGLIDLQADRLDRLVANLLDMTRIQSGALELRREPVAVSDLVDEALAVLGSSVELGRVHKEATESVPLVDVDHVLICQVLANLVDNALRYSPATDPVTITASTSEAGHVEVAVSDRGPGVAMHERTSIFQMINRNEAGGRGGLGLAIAKAFVEVHGERIWVETADGGIGARFVMTLPVARSLVDA